MKKSSQRHMLPMTVAFVLSLLVCDRAHADLLTCLNETGYAFVGGRSAIVLVGSDVVWLFDPDGDLEEEFCAPPPAGMSAIGASSGAGVIEYLAGTGLALATGSLGTPQASNLNRTYITAGLVLEFRVVPNDPQNTSPVEIDIVARHEFDEVRAEVSGLGYASNSQLGVYEVRTSPFGGRIGTIWLSEGLVVPSTGAAFDVPRTLTVPVDRSLYYFATIVQESTARGGVIGGQTSSAAADQSSITTFEITTEADATIEFPLVEALGLAPPTLGVVVPEASGGLLAGLAALGVLGGRRPRRARLPGSESRPGPSDLPN